jgi:cytochrome c oxidase cbb3-type subunit III
MITISTSSLGRSACLGGATVLLLVTACEREQRRFTDAPPSSSPIAFATESSLQPGPTYISSTVASPYESNAYAVSQGQQLFSQMNCSGCHAQGGGNMGPALMDSTWIYGSEPQQIFATIAEGRPNGMPAWKYRLSNQQIWELVTYVRSLSGLIPKGARPARTDHMVVTTPPNQTPKSKPKNAGLPQAAKAP